LWDAVGDTGAGFCLDTCHAHAGGIALSDLANTILGITGRIDLIHCNDSRDAFDSGADRHANLGNGTIPSTDDDIIVGNDVDGVDTLREESLDGTEALEKGAVKRYLNDITSLSSKIGKGVSGVDGDASENTLDLAHVHILELNLLVNQISGPEAEAIVVDSDKSGV
jgi:hypothetical protein